MKRKRNKKVSIKNYHTKYYFNALLVVILIASLVLSLRNNSYQFLIWPNGFSEVIGVSTQIITTLLSLIVSVIGIAISLQNETFFGVKSTKIYALRKVKHYSILEIIIISISICVLNLVFYMLDLIFATIGTLIVGVLFSIVVTSTEIPLMTKKDDAFLKIIKHDLIHCYLYKNEIPLEIKTVITHLLFEKNLPEVYETLKDTEDDEYNKFLLFNLLDIQCHFAFELKMYSDDGQLYKIGGSLLNNVFDVVLRHFEFNDETYSEIKDNKHLLTRVLFRLYDSPVTKSILLDKIEGLFQVLEFSSLSDKSDPLLSSIIIILISNTVKQGDFTIIKAVRKCLSHSFLDVCDICPATSVFAVISMQLYYLCKQEKDTPENVKMGILEFINESGEIVDDTKIVSWKALFNSFAKRFNVDYENFIQLANSNIHVLEYWLLGTHAKTIILDNHYFTLWYLTNLVNSDRNSIERLKVLLSLNADMKNYFKYWGEECFDNNGDFSPSQKLIDIISFYDDSKKPFGLFSIVENRNHTLFEIINQLRINELKKQAKEAKDIKNAVLAEKIEKSIYQTVCAEWGYDSKLVINNPRRYFSILLEKSTDVINFEKFIIDYCIDGVLEDIKKGINFKKIYGGKNFESELDNALKKNIKFLTIGTKNTIPNFYITDSSLKEKFVQICDHLEEKSSKLLGLETLISDCGFSFNCIIDKVEVRALTKEELSEKANEYQRSDGQYILRGAFMPKEEISAFIEDKFIVLTVIFRHQSKSSEDTVFSLLPYFNEEDDT